MAKFKRMAVVLAVFFCLSPVFAQGFQADVIDVIDGDTLDVLHDGIITKIRLNGIDCPEISQEFGGEAKKYTSETVLGKTVDVQEIGKDSFDMSIAEVNLPDGRNLSKELIIHGMAWWYSEYSTDLVLKELEREARIDKVGLWGCYGFPQAPWSWRKFNNISYSQNVYKPVVNQTSFYRTKTKSNYNSVDIHRTDSKSNYGEGEVIRVIDGDTVEVSRNGKIEKIRLNGIDSPESRQQFGREATKFTSDMVLGKVVKVFDKGKDKYGRTIADIELSDGRSLNKELVKNGMARWYKKYSDDQELSELEKDALANAKGIWASGNGFQEAPWDWRKNNNNSFEQSDESSLSTQSPTYNVPRSRTGNSSGGAGEIFTGPRGGRYTVGSNGKKNYIRRK